MSDPKEESELKCTCGENATDPHPCPFREDVNNDSETLCTCCPDCEHECMQDI